MQQQANIPIFTASIGVCHRGLGHYHLDEWHEPDWQRPAPSGVIMTVGLPHLFWYYPSWYLLQIWIQYKRWWCFTKELAGVQTHKFTDTDTYNTHRYRIDFELCITFLAVSLICEWSIQRIFFDLGFCWYSMSGWDSQSHSVILCWYTGWGPPSYKLVYNPIWI